MLRHVVGLLALFSSAYAQTTGTATLVGTATDTTGAVVAGAKATVVNTDTSFVSDSVTNNEGYYRVPYLNPGPYRLQIEAADLKKCVREGIICESAGGICSTRAAGPSRPDRRRKTEVCEDVVPRGESI